MLDDSPDNMVHVSHVTYDTFQVRRVVSSRPPAACDTLLICVSP